MHKRLTSTLIWLSVLLFAGDRVNASLYPTRPIGNTVLKAGEVETVKWKDSEDKPALKDSPRMRMDLYVANDTFLGTLAEGVNPGDLYHNVTIARDLWSDASNFHIRFYSKKPEMTIYTADFTMSGMGGKNKTVDAGTNGSGNGDTSNGFGLQAGSSNVSTVTATSTMGGSGDATTLSTAYTPARTHSGETAAGRRFSAERGLARYVFVLWPALIGIALAL